jgi:hypothetical protein
MLDRRSRGAAEVALYYTLPLPTNRQQPHKHPITCWPLPTNRQQPPSIM